MSRTRIRRIENIVSPTSSENQIKEKKDTIQVKCPRPLAKIIKRVADKNCMEQSQILHLAVRLLTEYVENYVAADNESAKKPLSAAPEHPYEMDDDNALYAAEEDPQD